MFPSPLQIKQHARGKALRCRVRAAAIAKTQRARNHLIRNISQGIGPLAAILCPIQHAIIEGNEFEVDATFDLHIALHIFVRPALITQLR
ncbi:MAG: hypothetical protein B7Z78_11025 [Rhodospirillales bacterium 20-60-12]|nr:MAG: hypothetical protein B7Z78_11025 [Rhodospirillales bacterium 20-60-12]